MAKDNTEKTKKESRPSLDAKALQALSNKTKGVTATIMKLENGIVKISQKEEKIKFSFPSIVLEKELSIQLKVHCLTNNIMIKDFLKQCIVNALNGEYSNIQNAGMQGRDSENGDKIGTKIPQDTYNKFKLWLTKNDLRLRDVIVHAVTLEINKTPNTEENIL